MTATISAVSAGLLAAACSSGSSSTSTSAPAATTSTADVVAPAASTPAAPSASAQPGASTTACSVGVLGFTFGAKTGTTAQQTQVVDLTNKGSSACTMDGFPGVDLVGVAHGQQNYSWPLVRSSARYSQVTLQPHGVAHFDLMYLPFAPGDGTDITVIKIVLTPPNTSTQTDLTWNQQVLLQDAATHPGTYIGPVTAGS
ncbi:MAG TPA: DUF4232 domain-containing protein [Trebonia sp.]